MGAGIHGGYGFTKGYKRVYKMSESSFRRNEFTREQLLDFIRGKTQLSTEIVEKISKREIRMSILVNELFDRYFNPDRNVVGVAYGNKIYLRRDSISIHSNIVHEGTHALEFINGVSRLSIGSKEGEIRAFKAEHEFQKAAKLPLEFRNEDEIRVHVWLNYKERR